MLSPQHPGSGWLIDYACGNLSPSFELVIATHLLSCTACREELAVAEHLGADLMLTPTALVPTLTADDILHSTRATPQDLVSRLPQPLSPALDLTGWVSRYLRISLPALRWRTAAGIAIAKLRDDKGDRLWLLRAQPGTVLPRHTHRGAELTLVLQGAYVIGDQLFAEGALEDADEETIHQPIVTTRGECLCLAATMGPLQFDSWAARIAGRVLGI